MKRVSTPILPLTLISNEWQLALLLGIATMLASPTHAQSASQAGLLMRATCGGSLLTADEGNSGGLNDYVDLSSVHHDLSAPVRTGASITPGTLAIEPIRIVKSTSASSIGMIAAMAQGQTCSEILVENWQSRGSIGVAPVWRLELTQAFIVARKEWQTADESAPAAPQESFELRPSRVSWTHFILDTSGVTPLEFTWDFETNTSP